MIEIIKNIFKMPNLWGGVIPIQAFGFYAVCTVAAGTAPSWWWICTLIGYICIMMLGVSAGYHRMLSHKGFETNPFIKKLILWFAVISGQGSPIFWCMIHRGYHHRYSDQDKDPHTPDHGFWHSYIWWMFKIKEGDLSTKYIVDLLRDEDCVFFHKHYSKILWISHIALALISFDLWLYLMLLPAFITLHSFAIQTSMNHSKVYGYRNQETRDNSVNVTWLWPLILGEAWHNNHHADAKNPNYGKRWWEMDPTYWLIKLIRTD
jgi:stearoyl-CoA desaturase (delta-9 desaturase)